MTERDDFSLLRDFAATESESAFAALVERHVHLVYSVALRSTGNAHAAQEISQAVFIILARKARSLTGGWQRRLVAAVRLRGDGGVASTPLSGWLHQTARLTAANYVRGEIRRQKREQETFMQSTLNETADETWRQIAPVLDDAISRLGAKDRDAIVLRFFENKSLGEVGAALGASEDAAKMRVNRALEKLRKIFTKRGVTFSAAAIAGAVSANSVQAAPVGLAKTISAVAIAKGAAAGGSTLALVKGALKIMAWTKMKTAVVAGAAVLLAAGTATVVVEKVAHPADPSWPSWADDRRIWQRNLPGVYFPVFLTKFPEVVLLRPTRFAKEPPDTVAGLTTIDGCIKDARKNVDIRELINLAYGMNPQDMARSLFPKDLPREHFDFLVTMPRDVKEVLRNELKTRFGLTAHREIRETDALLLRLADPKTWEQHINQKRNQYSKTRAAVERATGPFTKSTIDEMIPGLENAIGQPVVNQTGLTEHYDLYYEYTTSGKTVKENIKQALLNQLGLELVPTNMPIEMLVVEKAK